MTIGRMGFISQIVRIRFPQKCDILAIQAAERRSSQLAGDSLVRGTNGIDAFTFSTASLPGYTSGFGFCQAIPNATSGMVSSAITAQGGMGIYKGPAPTFNFGVGGGFTGPVINTDLVYTLGGAAKDAWNWNGGTPKYNYDLRAYMFINMTLFRKLFGGNTLQFSVKFGGSTYSNYGLWAEVLPNQRGIGFGNSLVGFGGVGLQTARSMGWNWQAMSSYVKGLGTPSGSGSLADLTPTMSVSVPVSGRPSMSGSGFASNNVFSTTGAFGSD